MRIATLRQLCRTDLYFLLRYALNRPDAEHPWLYARCREVQASPNGHLDLWAREHYKSTIITFAKTIQDILCSHGDQATIEREQTIGIFSFNAEKAASFVAQIKQELESNKLLIALFPDILYPNPAREAQSWSVQGGLIVQRTSNPKEPTVSGHGLVNAMPTGSHFTGRVYDDVITEQFARSPDMIEKATEAWELSLSLGSRGGWQRYIGTRYHYNDPYRVIMAREVARPRIYKVVDEDDKPVFFTPEQVAERKKGHGPYVWACQYMQDPKADEIQGFNRLWVRHYDATDGYGMNKYLIVDPANEKKKGSDYTAMGVIGLGMDGNYYLLDALYDRLNLDERTKALMALHRRWKPLGVGYEKYGKDTDIEHIQYVQEQLNYRFDITPLGGRMAKLDRIKRLIPIFADSRFYLPKELIKTNYEGQSEDIIEKFLIEEYDPFPVAVHDDFLDMLSRICEEDMNVIWPKFSEAEHGDRYTKARYQTKRRRTWQSG